MKWILRYFSWRYTRRHPLRAVLNMLVVALGAALFVAVDASNASTVEAFRRMVERLCGNAQLHVVRAGAGSVEAAVLDRLDRIPGVRAAPVIQLSTTMTRARSDGPLMVLGLDFRREADFRRWDMTEGDLAGLDPVAFLLRDAAIVTARFAARHGLKAGAIFELDTPSGPRPVAVGAIVKDEGPASVLGGNLLVLGLGSAQKLFRGAGRVDRVEICVTGDAETSAGRIREALGPDYEVRPPPRTNSMLDEALSRIQALAGISVVAALVGLFIIYNSLSLSVVERIREIGTLRALGATRGQVFRAVLGEGAVIGLLGSAVGIGLGYGLAFLLLERASQEVNQVAAIVTVEDVVLPLRTALLVAAAGGATALLATYVPARQAMTVSPIEMIRHGGLPTRGGGRCGLSCAVGLACLLLAAADTRFPVFPGAGLAGAFFAFLGCALVLPQLMLWGARLMQGTLARVFRLPGRLAADNLAMHPQRSALTATALAGTLALMISAAAIILGFKVHSARWMEEAFAFDYTVTAADLSAGFYAGAPLPESLLGELAGIAGVETVCGVRETIVPHGGRDIRIAAVDVAAYARMQARRGRTGLVPPAARGGLVAGTGAVVSGNFAMLHGVAAGHTLELETPAGRRRFDVLDVVEDYMWPQGTVFLDRAVYKALWNDPSLSTVDVQFREGDDLAAARGRVKEAAGRHPGVQVLDRADIRREAHRVLDQTFLFTNIQVTVAIFVGILGIVNTLVISVLRRRREIGLLRAVGMTRGQAAGMVVIESALIAAAGGLAGVALGLGAAAWPLSVHVLELSGYAVPIEIPWAKLGLSLGAAMGIGAVAGYVAARRAAGLSVIEAIGYE
mgnify:CR=1 FL=1